MTGFAMNMREERGNILFLILLAVILFAALSYAVTSSMRGGGKSVSDEQATTLAAEIVQGAVGLENALQRFLLTRGYSIEQISIAPTSGPFSPNTSGVNSNCATSACMLMDPAGGGYIYYLPSMDVRDMGATAWYSAESTPVSARLVIQVVNGVGTSLPDIVLVIHGIKSKICQEIDRQMNVPTPWTSAGLYGSETSFGSISSNSTTGTGTAMSPPQGVRSWCWDGANAGQATAGGYFHHVLLAR